MADLLGDASYLQDEIQTHFNDKDEEFLPEAEMLQILNEVHRLIAQRGVFRKYDDLAAVADQYIYDLSDEYSDYIKFLDITYEADSSGPQKMYPVTVKEFAKKRIQYYSLSLRPTWYALDGLNLMIWPAPDSNDDDMFQVRYEYMPTAITDNALYTLPISKAWWHVYVYGALWIAYKKAAPSQKSQLLKDEYHALFNEQLNLLLQSTRLPNRRLRPSR